MKITDAQIRELARELLTAQQHKDCRITLGARRLLTITDGELVAYHPTNEDRRAARERCAILVQGRK
jgi:hypothetical protein